MNTNNVRCQPMFLSKNMKGFILFRFDRVTKAVTHLKKEIFMNIP